MVKYSFASSARRPRARAFATSSVGPVAVLLLVLILLTVLVSGGWCIMEGFKVIQDSRIRIENKLNLG